MPVSRREFLTQSALASLPLLGSGRLLAQTSRRPRILLRSSWQIVNIGDIAHTPGVLALLEKYIPEAEVILWASGDLSPEVYEMEHQRFPNLKVVKGRIESTGRGSTPELDDAIRWADFLLHGSGASFVAYKDVAAFVKHTGKPYGVYGITYSGMDHSGVELLSQARFVYFRETVSLAKAREDGVHSPVMEFGPDGAFACDLRNDAAADAYLASSGLEAGKFACCIPRLRYTPYWLIKEGRKLEPEKQARNEEMKEHDHAPLRAAVTAVVRETGLKVLLCPEDMTQMQVGRELIYDKLPQDVKDRVVWREQYWLTDQALSTYLRSAGLFGLEMHSPIMCIGNGVPAIVCRFAEQTTKGFMWRDIGLGDWLFDMDQPEEVARLTPTVLKMVTDRAGSEEKVRQAQQIVQARQAATMQVVRDSLPRV